MKKRINTILAIILMAYTRVNAQISSNSMSSAVNEINNQFSGIINGILQLAMYLCGIAGLIGLFVTAYKLWTEEREGVKTVASWAGGLLLATLGLYVIKTIFLK